MADQKPAEMPAFSPQQIAFIQQIAFTPDKLAMLIQEMKKPYVDEAQQARDKRENQKTKDDFRAGKLAEKQRQAGCPHKDPKNNSSKLNLVRNFGPMPWGICSSCKIVIHPQMWEFHSDGKPYVIPEHPLYQTVIALHNAEYAEYAQAV